jgi:hypothetical protein
MSELVITKPGNRRAEKIARRGRGNVIHSRNVQTRGIRLLGLAATFIVVAIVLSVCFPAGILPFLFFGVLGGFAGSMFGLIYIEPIDRCRARRYNRMIDNRYVVHVPNVVLRGLRESMCRNGITGDTSEEEQLLQAHWADLLELLQIAEPYDDPAAGYEDKDRIRKAIRRRTDRICEPIGAERSIHRDAEREIFKTGLNALLANEPDDNA